MSFAGSVRPFDRPNVCNLSVCLFVCCMFVCLLVYMYLYVCPLLYIVHTIIYMGAYMGAKYIHVCILHPGIFMNLNVIKLVQFVLNF